MATMAQSIASLPGYIMDRAAIDWGGHRHIDLTDEDGESLGYAATRIAQLAETLLVNIIH
jgi:hypothetical protein